MTTTIEKLREALAEYDGKAVSILSEAEARFSNSSDYTDALIALIAERDGRIASGASWLIKSGLESGRSLSVEQVEALMRNAPQIEDWAAQLHICQCVQHLAIPKRWAAGLVEWLIPMLEHRRPFLKAWSLDALLRVASQHDEYRTQFDHALDRADEDEAASVRARARKLRAIGSGEGQ